MLVYEKTIIYLPGEHSHKAVVFLTLIAHKIMRSKSAQCNTKVSPLVIFWLICPHLILYPLIDCVDSI